MCKLYKGRGPGSVHSFLLMCAIGGTENALKYQYYAAALCSALQQRQHPGSKAHTAKDTSRISGGTLQWHQQPGFKAHKSTHLAAAPCSGTATQ